MIKLLPPLKVNFYHFLILEEVPLPVEAVEDAEWSCRERPDGDPDVLDVPDWDPLPSLVR